MLQSLLIWVLMFLPACRGDEPASAPQTQSAPPTAPAPAAATQTAPSPQVSPQINDLLDRLERSAADLSGFTADIAYEKEDATLGRRELRTGTLIYRLDQTAGDKSFAVLFDSTIIGRSKRDEPRHYIFNGRWLAEIDHVNKVFIKREIVPPGKHLDPLKLGEGPFPLPIGQPKSEVLARFDVTAADLPKEGMLKVFKPEDVEALLLVPKPGAKEAQEFAKVELFYDKATLLPVGIKTVEANGDRKIVRLTNLQRNPVFSPEQLAKLNIQEPDPREWRIDVRPWQAGDNGG